MSAARPTIQRRTRASRAAAGVCLILMVLAASMPWWAGRWSLRLLTEFLYVVALAQMWNLLAGYGGLLSVGQQAFVGIGGYSLVVFGLHAGINPFLVVPLAGVVAGLLAIPTAAVVLRLRGAQFAVATWVVAEVFRLLVANTASVGGGSGLSVTRAMAGMSGWWRVSTTFWIALGLGAGSTLFVYSLLRSRLGLALTAVRDSEPASESVGIAVRRVKWFVFVTSAVGCGMAGALIYITKLRVAPEAAFSIDWTATMFFVVVIGGIGTLEGPVVGAVVFFALRQALGDYGTWYLVVLGATAVGIMVWIPRGIWGWVVAKYDFRCFPVQRRLRLADSGAAARSTADPVQDRSPAQRKPAAAHPMPQTARTPDLTPAQSGGHLGVE